ncbi:MAG: hypothetical protein RL748_945, partial [Pseudomonadota bacterium]
MQSSRLLIQLGKTDACARREWLAQIKASAKVSPLPLAKNFAGPSASISLRWRLKIAHELWKIKRAGTIQWRGIPFRWASEFKKIKFALLGGAVIGTTALAMTSAVVVQAFHEKSAVQWHSLMQTGRMLPVRSADGALLG